VEITHGSLLLKRLKKRSLLVSENSIAAKSGRGQGVAGGGGPGVFAGESPVWGERGPSGEARIGDRLASKACRSISGRVQNNNAA
jgi:hypothetical protein